MKLLLTSGGVTNPTIEGALVGLLGRPIGECSALCIPTALYGHPWVGPGKNARDFITGESDHMAAVSDTPLRAPETVSDRLCRGLVDN